ncbi:heavy-metal-associated domain-containing protein [Clostridium estertheticum]|uniref:heavy-metal-associated domain-containing protein n=1 Tax=Clostridium estertheticum TaxID=238834 RepID=UPI001CF3C032|nr:heavy-metal-associated domain-containing protein [Clostridium estertheticum]MCB2338748.1 heavy-metal-associated domain-containing protein [Clostridium estertheticum]
MSLLSGMLTGYMLMKAARGQINNKSEISFNGTIQVKQNISGRLRIYCDKLRDNKLSQAINAQLCRIEGIKQVSVSLITGSILVIYDGKKIDSNLLQAAIVKLLGLDKESEKASNSIIMQEVTIANQALNYAMLDKTGGIIDLKTTLPIIFVGLAIKELVRTGNLGIPAPITLLYWAYNSFGLGGGKI